ncbi:homeobox domain-containing protein [Sporobolomyces koalae]|uniref:homeobox domain-containing protein n=1 Tax=Sporobolomyces koalae TaxID=500713 RepID=UPI00316F2A2B
MQSPPRASSATDTCQAAPQSYSNLPALPASHPPAATRPRIDTLPVPAAPSTLAAVQRVDPAPSPHAASTTDNAQNKAATGTAENPLIPKRRRRTTPTELAILEDEYRKKQRPDQPERAKIAQRLGMTNRAIQVWYQNRRQKDKKDSSSASSVAGSSSVASGDLASPKDLEGVTLSFSSSPARPPQASLYSLPAPSRPPSVSTPPSSASIKALLSSSDLYSHAPVASTNKENTAPAYRNDVRPAEPVAKPYIYSYPSTEQPGGAPYQSFLSSSTTATVQQPIFVHRASDSSIIAAKKHVRKRPLGSHAPVARTPSLSHAFDFPPSPPKTQRSTSAPYRSASVGCQPLSSSNGNNLTARRCGSNLFEREENAERQVSSVALESAETGAQKENEGYRSQDAQGARKAAAEDLLQHMQSDPPSASSPAPIPRTRIFDNKLATLSASLTTAGEYSDEEDHSGSFVPSAFAGKRPTLQHSHSLGATINLAQQGSAGTGGDPSKVKARAALLRSNSYNGTSTPSPSSAHLSISTSLANAHARSNPFSPLSAPLSSRTIPRKSPSLNQAAELVRSGNENACAVTALERKRASIISDGIALASAPAQRKSQDPVKERATKRRRSSGLASNISIDTDESMADLSFSSTSTASTVDSLATVDSPSSEYFTHRRATDAKDTIKAADDERECAELLLGLGGFF